MNRSMVSLFLFLGAATFCFQAISGVGIGILEIPLKCYMRLDYGEGNQRHRHFHYNNKDSHCYPFNYRGHKGNGNNFKTMDECVRVCKGLPADNVIPSNLIMTTLGSKKASNVDMKRTRNKMKSIFIKLINEWTHYLREIFSRQA